MTFGAFFPLLHSVLNGVGPLTVESTVTYDMKQSIQHVLFPKVLVRQFILDNTTAMSPLIGPMKVPQHEVTIEDELLCESPLHVFFEGFLCNIQTKEKYLL